MDERLKTRNCRFPEAPPSAEENPLSSSAPPSPALLPLPSPKEGNQPFSAPKAFPHLPLGAMPHIQGQFSGHLPPLIAPDPRRADITEPRSGGPDLSRTGLPAQGRTAGPPAGTREQVPDQMGRSESRFTQAFAVAALTWDFPVDLSPEGAVAKSAG